MKYSQQIGVVLCLLLVGACYLPWAFYPSIQFDATGMNAQRLGYGRPGLFHFIFSAVNIVLFLVPKVGAKRINLFIAAMNFAWGIRNFSLYSTCSAGECPVRKMGLYITLILAVGIFVMSMLPTTRVKRGEAFRD
ncbi:MAG: hypothetical protein QM610_03950 [Chitinophagaceae bacterium]